MSEPQSVHDLDPIELGGTYARIGFGVQDHVAAGFFIQMITDEALREVWCENQDDITLIWSPVNGAQVEFVQVKSNELGGLWSVAELCRRDTSIEVQDGKKKTVKKPGTSILERSLAYDRCKEPCCFRIVTCWQVNGDLRILTFPPFSEYRTGAKKDLDSLAHKLSTYLADYRSPNGTDSTSWATRALWQVAGNMEDIKCRNLLALASAVSDLGHFVPQDQLEEIYMAVVAVAWEASTADWRKAGRDAKIVTRERFLKWLQETVEERLRPSAKGGNRVREKMERAKLTRDSILSAIEERSHYLQERYSSRYIGGADYRRLEGEIVSALHSLRAQLDAGVYVDSGVQFHARCREKLESLRMELSPDRRPSLAFIHGCMYNIADRCTHRFLRAEP